MSAVAVILVGLYGAGLFNVETISLSHPNVPVFLAHADADGAADVFVLDGYVVTAYSSEHRGAPLAVELLEGTSAFDLADLDNDQRNEIVGVQGARILCYELPPPGNHIATTAQPTELFRLPSPLSIPASEPYPCVLAVEREKQIMLVLPREEVLELRALDGALAASYAADAARPLWASSGSPFAVQCDDPPCVGGPGALEMCVSRVVEFEPEWPPGFLPATVEGPFQRRGTASQARDAATRDEQYWLWFPLMMQGSTARRALYALAPPDYRNTLMRIREIPPEGAVAREGDVTTGPERRYPGVIIVLDDDRPDFNNDGYADVLLWKAPEPGGSIDALTRALNSGTWPLSITAHVFSPAKNRYEPKPAAQMRCRVPVAWFLAMDSTGPIRHCVLRDFDGDGATDLGCSTSAGSFSVWLYREDGFRAEPDFTHVFPAAIESVEFKADLDGRGSTSVGLRTKTALYVLRATPKRGSSAK